MHVRAPNAFRLYVDALCALRVNAARRDSGSLKRRAQRRVALNAVNRRLPLATSFSK
jgi:hypothetical protein